MRGSVVRKDAGWTARWDELTEDGDRRQRRRSGFATRREAQAFLSEQLQRLRDGSYSAPTRQTFGEFLLSEWLPAIEGTVRPLTATNYERTVRVHLVPNVGSLRLQGVSGAHLNALYRKLEENGLSAGTRRLVHAVAHRALRDAMRWGKLPRNPADLADPPSTRSSRRVKSWTATEVGRSLEHVAGDRYFALWRLAATSGMRRGELLGLTWRHVDLAQARLSVEQQLLPTKGGLSFGPPNSARSRRTVALDSETVNAIERHREAQVLERDFAAAAYDDRDLVFCNELGKPIHPDWLSALFREHRKAAGIPTGSLHVLRHTAATLALTGGVPVHIVAARCGDDPNTILKTYAHLLPQSDEIAAERVAAALAA
jgi:integrase